METFFDSENLTAKKNWPNSYNILLAIFIVLSNSLFLKNKDFLNYIYFISILNIFIYFGRFGKNMHVDLERTC